MNDDYSLYKAERTKYEQDCFRELDDIFIDESKLRKEIEQLLFPEFDEGEEMKEVRDQSYPLSHSFDKSDYRKRRICDDYSFSATEQIKQNNHMNEIDAVHTPPLPPRRRRSLLHTGSQTRIDEQLDKDLISKIESFANTPSCKDTEIQQPSSFSAMDPAKLFFQYRKQCSTITNLENTIKTLEEMNNHYSRTIVELQRKNEELNQLIKEDMIVNDLFIEEHFESFFITEIQSEKTVQKCKICEFMEKNKTHSRYGRFEKTPKYQRIQHIKKHLTREGMTKFLNFFLK